MKSEIVRQLKSQFDILAQKATEEDVEFWFARFGITQTRPLADFLPTLTIAAKNLATEITNHNVQQEDLHGEPAITHEHVQNNVSVRDMLGQRGIKPENLPQEEDIKKLERRVKSEEKKLEKKSGKLPEPKA
jgi:DNA-damage-inducible protein D